MGRYNKRKAEVAPCPQWPLPYDSKWAVAEEEQEKDLPEGQSYCPRCRQLLVLTPGDTTGARIHKRGVKCRKNRESVTMNDEGYHAISPLDGSGYWTESLRSVMREGDWGKYFPAPVVSFIRWKTANNRVKVGKGFQKELEEFMALSEGEQIAHLTGAILQYEYTQEDKVGTFQACISDEWGTCPF